jgi:tetratricopeptide (TPR) repeat protein
MKTLPILVLICYLAGVTTSPPVMPQVEAIVGATASSDARADFNQGLLLLHNFEYPDAADKFRDARQKDPTFALAYWGEAMTFNHPIWLSQDLDEARKVIEMYKKVAKNETTKLPSLDADLLRSLDILYGDGTKPERDKAYATFMAGLYERYPGNHDVAAFYALSLLGQAAGWDQELCNRAAKIAKDILNENPKHPGALHYFIHAEDHPEFAKHAWEQANEYAKVASYSGHALHMPSHIYLALGSWNDVVKSNEVSWQAGVDRKESRKLTNNALNYHAHWWLAYGYLQQGRIKKAEEVVRAQLAFARELPSPAARNHFVIMRGHYLIETNNWQSDLAKEAVDLQGLPVQIRSLDRFVRGVGAFRGADQKVLGDLISQMEKDIRQADQLRIMNDGIAQCGAIPYGGAGIIQSSILLEELRALQAVLKNDAALADKHFRKATDLEAKNGHFFGPPEIMKPTNEVYGEFLLSIGRSDEAATNFEKALEKAPGRNQSLHGLATALARNNDTSRAEKARQILKTNLQHAEVSEVHGLFQEL